VGRRGVLSAITALVALAASATDHLQAQQSPGARFRAGVELVSLSVTVTDGTQRHVTDLEQDDFIVLEEGRPQLVTFFRKTDVRMALALLVDSSASMEQALPIAQEAAAGFVRQLGPADMATVIDFDSRVQVLADFTNDKAVLEEGIRQTSPGGSTSLFNAVYIALRELGKIRLEDERDVPRRRVVVLLSDGEDTSSLVNFDEVAEAAARSDTVIYAIGLGIGEAPGRRSSQDATFVLRRFAQQTGGRAFFPAHAKELSPVYGQIREELSSQYMLAYVSTSPRGQWRRLSVRVKRPGVSVRTREGYFAGS
jgi:Ca-activated chloride channel family protein